MSRHFPIAWVALALLTGITPCARAQPTPPARHRADVIVYGGTSAAVVAAIQVKTLGRTAILVAPDRHLGGLSSGGLGYTDSGNKAVIGGLSREFYHRIWRAYQDPYAWRWQRRESFGNRAQGTPAIDGEQRTMWVFEPRIALAVFEQWVVEAEIPVVRNAWLDRERGVRMNAGRIASLTTLDGQTFEGEQFIDASYEGDLMAAAGVDFTTGREANALYNETLNGVQVDRAHSHQFTRRIDPFLIPGDPATGLLPRVHDGDPGRQGQADHRLQAFNFRVCLTRHEPNRIPFPKPAGYDPFQYELLLRYLQAGARHVFGKFDGIPNLKTDTNNHGAFSTDNIGMNYDYPNASYSRRREIIREHETYQKGYFHFLANDPRVPDEVRLRMAAWGLPKDEFIDNGHWPHQIYVREARRMVADFVLAEPHLRRQSPTPDPVGMGSYNMDSHNVQRYVAYDELGLAYVLNEGDIQVNPGGPYPVSYRAIVPRRGQAPNLLVPVCISASHIAYGSVRMEPVFMILAQSAATAACIAIDSAIAVQDVPYPLLRDRLIKDGQVLDYTPPSRAPKPELGDARRIDPAKLKGLVIDDTQAKTQGDWKAGHSVGPFVGAGYLHDSGEKPGERTITFPILVPKPGKYEVRLSYPAFSNRATRVAVRLTSADGETQHTLNQREKPPIDGAWRSLGIHRFDPQTPAHATLHNASGDGHTIADALWLLPVE